MTTPIEAAAKALWVQLRLHADGYLDPADDDVLEAATFLIVEAFLEASEPERWCSEHMSPFCCNLPNDHCYDGGENTDGCVFDFLLVGAVSP